MPKVSDQYLEDRKRQIVDAAFDCFARKGFHPTTMNDICTAARMSAGAVYRYFSSKEEIIASACDESQRATDQALLTQAMEEPDAATMLRGLADAFFSRLDGPEAEIANRATLQLWAELAINPTVRESYEDRHDEMRDSMLSVVEEVQRRGSFSPELDPSSIVGVLFALFHGFMLQKAIDPTTDTAAYVQVVHALLTGQLWTGKAVARDAQENTKE